MHIGTQGVDSITKYKSSDLGYLPMRKNIMAIVYQMDQKILL